MSPEGRSRPRHLVAGAVGFPHFRPETKSVEAKHRPKTSWHRSRLTQKSSTLNSPSFKTWRASTRFRTSIIIGPKNTCARKLRALGFESMAGFFIHYICESCNRRKGDISTIVSLGSGNSDFKVNLARRLRESGTHNFHFVCLEMNGPMLERGKILAASSGLSNHFSFTECDLNNWTAEQQFDSILAIHSLHHVMAFEKLFDEVLRSLSDDGASLINDMIGRNGHIRWPEALEVVQAFWKELPHSKKYNHQLKRFEDEFVNWDCSTEGFEGIRAQDILSELIKRFEFDCFLGFSNVTDIFVDRCFGHNFDPKNESDLAFIDRVAMTDEALLE